MSPRTKKQVKELREKSKTLIRDAGLSIFVSKGYHQATMAEIAREAGISKGLIYNYYASKEDLLNKIIDDVFDQTTPLMDYELKGKTPQERLKQIIEDYFQLIESNPAFWRLLVSLSLQPDIMHKITTSKLATFKSIIVKAYEVFRQMGSDDPMRDYILFDSHIDGLALKYVFLPDVSDIIDTFPWEAMKKKLIETYCS